MVKIKVITLLNGQDIIGEVTENDQTYFIKKPAAVLLQPKRNQQGQQVGAELALAPWPMLADPDSVKNLGVHISKSTVITVNVPNRELLDGYTKTMSGLIVPSSPSLIME